MPTDPIGEIPILITGDDSDLQKAINDAVQMAEDGAQKIGGAFYQGFQTSGDALEAFVGSMGKFSDGAQGIIDKQKELDDELIQARGNLVQIQTAYEDGAVSINTLVRAQEAVADAAAKANVAFSDSKEEVKSFGEVIAENLEHPLQAAAQAIRDMADSVGPMGIAFVAGAAALGELSAKITELVLEEGAAAKETENLSYRLNLNFEDAKHLSEMSDVAGVNMGVLTRTAMRLSTALEDSAGSGSKVSQALQDMGIETTNGGDALLQLLQHLADVSDATERMAEATAVMGRGAAQLEPLINDYDHLSAAIDSLGGKLDSEGVAKLLAANEAAKLLGVTWDHLKEALAATFAPAVTEGLQFLISILNRGGETPPLSKQIDIIDDKLTTLRRDAESATVAVTSMMGGGFTRMGGGSVQSQIDALEAQKASLQAQDDAVKRSKEYNAELDRSNQLNKEWVAGEGEREKAAAAAAEALRQRINEDIGSYNDLLKAQQDATKEAANQAKAFSEFGIGVSTSDAAIAKLQNDFLEINTAFHLNVIGTQDWTKALDSLNNQILAINLQPLIALNAEIQKTAAQLDVLGQSANGQAAVALLNQTISGKVTGDLAAAPSAQDMALAAARKTLGLTVDQTTGQTSTKQLQAFGVEAAGATSLSELEAAWAKISYQINKLAQTDLPTAAKYYQEMLDAAVRLGATTGQQLLLQTQINNAIITAKAQEGVDATAEILANEQLKIKVKLLYDAATATGQIAVDLNKAFDNTFKNLSQGLTDVITGAKGLGDMLSGVLHSFETMFVKSITDAFVKGVQDAFLSTGIQQAISGGVSKLVGAGLSAVGLGAKVISGAAGTVGDIANSAATNSKVISDTLGGISQAGGEVANAASGAASVAGGAAGAFGGIVGAAGLGVAIASGIVQGIQGARQNNLLSGIEISTRATKEQLVGGIQPTLNTYLPELNHMVDIWQAINDVNDALRYGTLNVQIAGTNEITGHNPTGSTDTSPIPPDTPTPEEVSTATKVTLDSVKRLTLSTDSASTAFTDITDAAAPVADAISSITPALESVAPAIDYTTSAFQDLSFSASTLSDTFSQGGSQKLNPIPSASYAPGGPIPLYSSDQIATFTNQYAASLQQAQQALDVQRQASNQLIGTFQQAQIEAGLVGSGVYNGPGGATMGRVPTYMGLTSPGNPSAAFASVADAMAWLQQYTTALSGPTGYQTTQQQRDLTMMRMGSLRSYGAPDINVAGMASTYQQMLQNQTVGNYGVPVTVNAVDPSGSQITDAIIQGLLQKGIRIR